MYRVSAHIRTFALALVAGVALATLWVNLAPSSYYDLIEYRLWAPDLPLWTGVPTPVLSLQKVTSEALMALFIAFIAKELWEALVLERGALAGATRRAIPFGAVAGGAIGAVAVWLLLPPGGAEVIGPDAMGADGIGRLAGRLAGWPLPIGSDVILCYVFGAWVFGRGHPALHLLLLVAIAFDLLGLLALALDYPTQGLRLVWLIPSGLALVWVWAFSTRHARSHASEREHRRAAALWPYGLAGVICWAGIALAGLPGALGLLPLIPLIPHAERSFGLFAEAEAFLHDPLSRLAHLLVWPLPVVLFLFGLTRGALDLAAFGPMTLRVLLALWLGKPLGLLIGAALAMALRGGKWPAQWRLTDLILIAVLSGMGLTVPLLALDSALPGGMPADEARAGLALSLGFGLLALGLGRLFGSRRF